jgi:hypothetical protein
MMCAAKFLLDDKFDPSKIPFKPMHNGAGRGVGSGAPQDEEELEVLANPK